MWCSMLISQPQPGGQATMSALPSPLRSNASLTSSRLKSSRVVMPNSSADARSIR